MFVEDMIVENSSFFLDPENTIAGEPAMAPDVGNHCRAGFIARSVEKLVLRNVDITDQLGPAVSVSDSRDLTLRDLTLRTVSSEPMICLENIRRGVVLGCALPGDAITGLCLPGPHTSDVRVRESDLERAK